MDKIRVLLCKAGKCAEIVEIENTLEAKQRIVGGDIEVFQPFDDDAIIVCNDEGKLRGMSLNRAIYDENGLILDVIAGDFIICSASPYDGDFHSLPKELEEKYMDIFYWPEQMFMVNGKGLKSVKYNPEYRKHEVKVLKGEI